MSANGLEGPNHEEISKPEEEQGTEDPAPSKGGLSKLNVIPIKIQAKTKQILHINGGEENEPIKTEALSIIDNDPAFRPQKLIESQKETDNEKDKRDQPPVGGKASGKLRSIAKAITHPKDSITKKATKTTAAKLSSTQRPYISQAADLDLLDAHKEACSAQASSQNVSNDGQTDIFDEAYWRKFNEMKAHRESLHVAWTTNRHVTRVRVVPKRHMNYPDPNDFAERDAKGHLVSFDILKWLGHTLIYYTQDFSSQYIDDFDELPFDKNSLRYHVERIVEASAPWQSWAMNVRSIYRWENPKKTGKWLALYIYLWYTQHIVAYLWIYVIYKVLKNRYYPASSATLQESMQRVHDRQSTAYKFGELIDRHGGDSWIEPLIDDLGPFVQLQLGDMANMLEVLTNFYEWKAPRKTAATLFLLFCCLLIAVFTDMAFCMKIIGLLSGGAFFLCWPISSWYPRYRYLVSPFKWVFWDIPTDAEFSFRYLLQKAQICREKIIEGIVEQEYSDEIAGRQRRNATQNTAGSDHEPDDTQDEETSNSSYESGNSDSSSSPSKSLLSTNFLSFRALSHGHPGHLILHPTGLFFAETLNPARRRWQYTFLDLAEMKKPDAGSRVSKFIRKKTRLGELELWFTDGSREVLEGMRERDGAFNAITGEASKVYYCGQEIGREVQSGISAVGATDGACWATQRVAQAGHNRETYILDRLAALEVEAPKWRSTYKHSLAIRNRFLNSFLMDHFPAQYSSSEHRKKEEGDRSAHHGAPLIDSFLYTDGVRSDTSTSTTLYGLLPGSVSLLPDNEEALEVLEYHATMLANSDEPVPEDLEEMFHKISSAP